MTRGRKKDLTIPPTRALTQQRDYRARRAKYVSDLEERCFRAERENVKLRQEIDALRSGVPLSSFSSDPRMLSASSELLQSLARTSDALHHFHEVAFPERSTSPSDGHPFLYANALHPAFFPSAVSSPSSTETVLQDDGDEGHCYKDSPHSPSAEAEPPSRHSLKRILCQTDIPPYHPREESSHPDPSRNDAVKRLVRPGMAYYSGEDDYYRDGSSSPLRQSSLPP